MSPYATMYVFISGNDDRIYGLPKLTPMTFLPEASASIQFPADPVEYGLKHGDGENVGERGAPKEVPPVVHGEVEIVVIHFGTKSGSTQNGGYIEARDRATGKKLWGIQVYTTVYDENRERDVQDVFITAMKLTEQWVNGEESRVLVVQDGKQREYIVDLKNLEVTEVPAVFFRDVVQ